MSTVNRVLIVGGGIGGLVAAIALHRRGIAADIVEINPDWSVYGVGIIQPSNALRALSQVGLGEQCLQVGRGFPGWQMCDSRGAVFVEVPNENIAPAGFPPNNGITRPHLHKILTEATLAQKTRVRLGVTIDSWIEASSQIEVHFTDGSTEVYDLIIGADGINSKVRVKLFGDSSRPRFTGESVWRYNLPRPQNMLWGSLHFGQKSKAGLVPLSDSLMYLFLVTAEPGNPRMPADRLHQELQDRLGEYGGLVGSLREQIIDPSAVVYRPMEALLLTGPWHRGRVVLIGDAAHTGTPHLAQGAAMAVEDAVLLAQMLSEHTSLPIALDEFVARRYPRCELMVKTGLQMGEWEMLEWAGTRASETDHGGLMARTVAQLMLPM